MTGDVKAVRPAVSLPLPEGLKQYARAAMLAAHGQDPSRPRTMAGWVEQALTTWLAAEPGRRQDDATSVPADLAAALEQGPVAQAVYRIDPGVRALLDEHLAGEGRGCTIGQVLHQAMVAAVHAAWIAGGGQLRPAGLDKYERGVAGNKPGSRAGQGGVSVVATRDFMDHVRGAYMHAVTGPNPPSGFRAWAQDAITTAMTRDPDTLTALAADDLAAETARQGDPALAGTDRRAMPRRFTLDHDVHQAMLRHVKTHNDTQTDPRRRYTRGSYALTALAAAIAAARTDNGGVLAPVAAGDIIKNPIII